MTGSPPNSGGFTFDGLINQLRAQAAHAQAAEEQRGRFAALKRDQRHRWYEGYYDPDNKADEYLYVRRTPEFARVSSLPTWDQSNLAELAVFLTKMLKKPEGTMALWESQAAVLKLLYDHGSVLGSVSCGGGKTLSTFLAPVLMQAQRAVLIIPAKLKKKTVREFKRLAEHWQSADIKVVSYAYLSRNKEFLNEYQPDLLMGDEFHKLKNMSAACTRQVDRYLTANPHCRLIGLSGTLMKRSLMDFHHMTRWVGGLEGMPLPASQEEAKLWARAVDKDPPGQRILPGWLALWHEAGELPSLDNVDKAVGKRIYSTPGFFRTEGIEYGGSLLIETLRQTIPNEVRDMVDQIVETKTSPNGDEALPSDIWRHKTELALGFYYEWDPAPPEDWMVARRIWRAFVREQIEADYGLDTEMQVANACKRGDINHNGSYTRWRNVRDSFKPNTVTRWVTDSILRGIIGDPKRMFYTGLPTLVWVKHQAVGYKLAELTGLKYFRSAGTADDGTYVEDLQGKESAILSIDSNAEGLNLQAWSENIVLSWPSSGRTCEQMLARTHRAGQPKDEVNVRGYLGLTDAFEQSLRDAQHIQNVQGAPQRLLMADLTNWDPTKTKTKK